MQHLLCQNQKLLHTWEPYTRAPIEGGGKLGKGSCSGTLSINEKEMTGNSKAVNKEGIAGWAACSILQSFVPSSRLGKVKFSPKERATKHAARSQGIWTTEHLEADSCWELHLIHSVINARHLPLSSSHLRPFRKSEEQARSAQHN